MVGLAVASDGLLRWQKKGVVFEGGGPEGKCVITLCHTYIHTYIQFKVLEVVYTNSRAIHQTNHA